MSGTSLANAGSIIREFIVSELLIAQGRAAETVLDDTSLFRTSIIDSFGLFRLVLHLEEQFDVTINDEEVVPEHFDTIATIVQFLQSKQEGLNSNATGTPGAGRFAD